MPVAALSPSLVPGQVRSEALRQTPIEREWCDVVETLLREYPENATPVVIGAMLDAVTGVRRWGCPEAHVRHAAVAVTHWLLAERHGTDLTRTTGA
jgi:hypothetical protein